MAQFPCLPLWTDAWVADTHHLSAQGERGRAKRDTYLELLVLMWRTPHCRVPDDNGWLMTRLHMTKDEIRELLRPVVEEFCTVEDGWIVQHRLQKEFVRVFAAGKRMSAMRKRRKTKDKAIDDSGTTADTNTYIYKER